MSIQEFAPAEAGRLEFTREELLANVPYEEPLTASDVRCHGGFVDGAYVSPRTLHRVPAIRAWKARLRDEGQPLVYVPREVLPPNYPSYEQAKLLLQEGIRDPITRALTIISIVEGFGAMIRDLPLPDFKEAMVEDLGGTALAHLGQGLFEAHARDEAGHRAEGGHKQMWEAARDLGLDRPEVPDDVLARMMGGGGGRGRSREPLFGNLAPRMEEMIRSLANVMVVEIFAFDVFKWGSRLLGDPEISANPTEAAAMVGHIRSDENPHVEYLRTALSEIRARTLRTTDGAELSGAEVVDRLLLRQLRGIASSRPKEQRERVRQEIRDEITDERMATDLIRRFEDLDSGWTYPEDEGVELILR